MPSNPYIGTMTKQVTLRKPNSGAFVAGITTDNGSVYFGHDGEISCVPDSTAIKWWNWNNGVLAVQYRSAPHTYYFYQAVPLEEAWNLIMAESVGAFIAKNIKPNYEVR